MVRHGPSHRFSALLGVLLAWLFGAGGAALAGWSAPADVPGSANDVEAWDGGQLTVSTSQGGFEVLFDGTLSQSVTGSNVVSTLLDASGCMLALDSTGTFQTVPPCTAPAPIGFGSPPRRVRAALGGYGYTCAAALGTGAELAFTPNVGTSNWTLASVLNATDCGATSALNFGGQSYGLFGLLNAAQNLRLLSGSTVDANGRAGAAAVPRDTALVGDPSTGMRAFVVDFSGGLYVSEVDGGFGGFVAVPPPVSGATFRSISVYQDANERFGLAVMSMPDGGTEIFSAVPDPSPNTFGLQWVPSTAPPTGLAGQLGLVNCYQAAACGLATSASNIANVSVYENASPPGMSATTTATIAPGESASFPVPADPDGDAVWVTTTPPAGFTAEVDAGTIILGAPDLLECDGGTPFTFTFSTSDGRLGHDTQSQIDVTLLRDTPPVPPVLSPDTVTLNAGGMPVTVSAQNDPAECQNFGFAWQSPLVQSGITVTPASDNQSATVTPPETQCDSSGTVTRAFNVITTSSSYGNSAGAATLTVTVNGFGRPLVPFVDPDRVEDQPAGTSASYAADQTHVCNDGGTALVDVDTRWWLDGGAPASVTFTPPLTPGGTVSDSVTVDSSDACHDEVIQLVAQNENEGLDSAQGTLTVRLNRNFDPLDAGTFAITSTDGGFAGESELAGVNCVDERALSAKYVVEFGGKVLEAPVHPVPGPWSVIPRTSCMASARVSIHAEVVGAEDVRSNELEVTPLPGVPALGELDAGPLRVRCSDEDSNPGAVIAEGPLRHDPGMDSCLGQTVRWSLGTDGPEASFSPASGDEVVARLQAPRWDDLVDRDVAFAAVARSEAEESDPATVGAHLVPDSHFVTARIDTDAPVTEEGGLIGLVATLENTTSCPVEGARWIVTLEGLRPFGEFASVAGLRAPVRTDGNTIVVDGIALPPHQPIKVVVSARAALLGQPTARGQVVLGDDTPEAISDEAWLGQGVPETGCGCAAVDAPSLLAAALGLLTAAARRRSKSR